MQTTTLSVCISDLTLTKLDSAHLGFKGSFIFKVAWGQTMRVHIHVNARYLYVY